MQACVSVRPTSSKQFTLWLHKLHCLGPCMSSSPVPDASNITLTANSILMSRTSVRSSGEAVWLKLAGKFMNMCFIYIEELLTVCASCSCAPLVPTASCSLSADWGHTRGDLIKSHLNSELFDNRNTVEKSCLCIVATAYTSHVTAVNTRNYHWAIRQYRDTDLFNVFSSITFWPFVL